MNRTTTLLLLLIIGASTYSLQPPTNGGQVCPVAQGGNIFTSQVTASTNTQGQVNLVSGTDVQEYSYTFTNTYTSRPGIAIAVYGFNSQQSQDLFFSIKPVVHPGNFSQVTFVIKTTWCKTTWSQLKFSFLV